ncbi:hypothetical protein ACFPJ4_06665 [Lysinimonas soli]|uniref:Uncharacterized protein n=1 Tax=Lysinimonas soli TaxID=1074233 RepID=A0ABW0NNB0_9MICO
MSLLSTLLQVGVHAEQAPAPLIMPSWAFPAIAAGAFLVLALVSWSYRDVANRHSDKTGEAADHADAGHGHH